MASIQERAGVLGYDNAAHLLRRATFAPSQSLINSYATKTASEALASLFQFDATVFPAPRYSGVEYIPTIANPSPVFDPAIHTNRAWLKNWWLHCAYLDQTLQHKIAFMLHTIFVTDDTINIYTLYDHHELLKYHANGSLKELAVRITRNLHMLYYLDNRLNTASSPNENYAREFLELFTILKGEQIATGNYTNYTEQDVQVAAKVLTGFDGSQGTATSRLNNVDPVTKIPQGTVTLSKHDKSNKTFSAAFGNTVIPGGTTVEGMINELQAFIDMIFAQRATALNYARRIYRFFVGRNISTAIEADIISPMADTLQATQYSLQAVVTQLLSSLHFYDEDEAEKGDVIWGAKVKSPIDLALSVFKDFGVTIPDYVTQNQSNYSFYNNRVASKITNMGLPLWVPFSVVGYAAYTEAPNYDRLWLTPLSLGTRYNDFITQLISGYSYSGVQIKLDTVLFVRNSGYFSNPAEADILLADFYKLLFTSTPQGARHGYFRDSLLGGLSIINWRFDWNAYIGGGSKTSVATALNRLVTALVKSPEYQVQ